MIKPLQIFIGYDDNESDSFALASSTLIKNSKQPLQITPLCKKHFLSFYQRERLQNESSDFSITRFLVPYLSNFENWSLYIDCDVIIHEDISKIFELKNERYSIMCCKHQYDPSSDQKKGQKIQTNYQFKNWSSLMLFNNKKCKKLTPNYIQHAKGLELHQFQWLDNHNSIGPIPLNWNHLVDEENQLEPIYIRHYTKGTPKEIDVSYHHAKIWFDEYFKLIKKKNEPDPSNVVPMTIEDREIKSFSYENEKYYQIPPIFKSTHLAKTDYIQLISATNGKIFHLKSERFKHRNLDNEISQIYSQYFGSQIAMAINIETQACKLITIKQENWLLTEDIRAEDTIFKMEPITYLSQDPILNTEKDIVLIKERIENFVHKKTDDFFAKVLILDFISLNSSRDARSFRILFDNTENANEDKLIYDFIIETPFAIEAKDLKFYTTRLLSLIEKLNLEYYFMQNYNQSLDNLIQLTHISHKNLPDELEKKYQNILLKQIEELQKVYESISNKYSHRL